MNRSRVSVRSMRTMLVAVAIGAIPWGQVPVGGPGNARPKRLALVHAFSIPKDHTFQHDLHVPQFGSDGPVTVRLPRFPAAAGELLAISVTTNVSTDCIAGVEAIDCEQTLAAIIGGTAVAQMPRNSSGGIVDALARTSGQSSIVVLDGFDGFLDYGGASGVTFHYAGQSESTETFLPGGPVDLSYYVDPVGQPSSTVDILLDAGGSVGLLIFGGDCGWVQLWDAYTSGRVTIRYEYAPR